MVGKSSYGELEPMKIKPEIQKEKIILLAILLFGACFLTYYFHRVLGVGTVFTHFFYIPIILASLWWKRKGLTVAIFLALFLIFNHLFFHEYVATADDYFRALMFLIIALVVALLSERIAQAQRKTVHINAVLATIRDINQLISREKDRDKLLEGICDSFLEARSYYNAWIVLLDESGKLIKAAGGSGDDFSPMLEHLKRGGLTDCGRTAFSQSKIVITEDPSTTCRDCPLAQKYSGRGALTVRLGHDGKIYGLLSVSIPIDFSMSKEEHDLFRDLAEDVAYALYTIEQEDKRKLAEASLLESEEKYRMLFEHAGFAITLVDTGTGDRIIFNRETHDRLGYSRSEYKELDPLDFDADKSKESLIDSYKEIIKKGSSLFERRLKTKSGEIRNILISAVPVKIGGKYFIHNISADITNLKQAEEALRESEEFSTSLLEYSPNPILVMNADTSIKYVNRMFEELTGYTSKETIGKKAPFPWWIDDPRSGRLSERKQDILKDRRGFEKLFQKKNGELFWVEISNAVIEANGELKYNLSNWIDVTKSKRAEREYRTLFDRMLDGFALHEIICDRDGKPIDYRFLDANPAFEQVTQLKVQDIIGKTVLEVLPGIETSWIEIYGKVALTGEPIFFENYAQELGRHFEVAAYQPQMGQFACIFQDVSERKRAQIEKDKLQSQLQQAHKMESIGTLAGGIAHDFNNILLPVIGYAEMTVDDVSEDSQVRNNLNEILKGALRARDLVQQILTFSRQADRTLKPMKIQPVIKEVLKLIRSSLPSTIAIRQDLEKDCGLVMADPTQIHQMVMNLCTNAYHAMEETGGTLEMNLGEIELTVDDLIGLDMEPGPYLCLKVGDTGHGIKQSVMDRIFDPYFTTKETKGTGLGLSVVHGIVKSYGGDIRVYSEPGKETVFHVYLPVIQTQVETMNIGVAAPLLTGDERILLVDDEEPIVDIERQLLERLGYQVTVRTSSTEVLEAFKANPDMFDLVITDMTMPNMTGDKLAGELIKIRSDIPVILCTGFSEKMSKERADSLGIKGFLMKPFVIRDLSKIVRDVLDNKSII